MVVVVTVMLHFCFSGGMWIDQIVDCMIDDDCFSSPVHLRDINLWNLVGVHYTILHYSILYILCCTVLYLLCYTLIAFCLHCEVQMLVCLHTSSYI